MYQIRLSVFPLFFVVCLSGIVVSGIKNFDIRFNPELSSERHNLFSYLAELLVKIAVCVPSMRLLMSIDFAYKHFPVSKIPLRQRYLFQAPKQG